MVFLLSSGYNVFLAYTQPCVEKIDELLEGFGARYLLTYRRLRNDSQLREGAAILDGFKRRQPSDALGAAR